MVFTSYYDDCVSAAAQGGGGDVDTTHCCCFGNSDGRTDCRASLVDPCAKIRDRHDDWVLVFEDRFEDDLSSWSHEVNSWGGGNGELQFYTDREENAAIVDSQLTIIGRKERFEGASCPWMMNDCLEAEKIVSVREYTSSRLRTDWCGPDAGFKYGRFEASIK